MYHRIQTKTLLEEALYQIHVIILPLSAFVGYRYLQDNGTKWKMSDKISYQDYFITSNAQLKVAIAIKYGDSLYSRSDLIHDETNWAVVKMIEAHSAKAVKLVGSNGTDVSDIGTYILTSDIQNE